MKRIKDVLAFYGSLDRGLYPVLVLTAAIEALESFGVLLISTAVLERLTAGEDTGNILLFIVVLTFLYGGLRMVGSAMGRYRNYRMLRFQYRYQEYVTEQVLKAPYWLLEKEDFVETINQVRQNDNIYDLTMSILNKVSGIVHTGVSVLVALVSFIRLFGTLRYLGEAAFIPSLLVLLLFLLIVASTGYVVWRRRKNAETTVRLMEDVVKRNKAAMYLLNEVIVRYPVGKHIRLYGMQDRLLAEQEKQINGFAELEAHMNRLEMKPGLVGDISSVAISGMIYLTVSAAAIWGSLGVGSIIWYAGVVQRLMEAIRQMINLFSGMYSDCTRQQVIAELREMISEAFSEADQGTFSGHSSEADQGTFSGHSSETDQGRLSGPRSEAGENTELVSGYVTGAVTALNIAPGTDADGVPEKELSRQRTAKKSCTGNHVLEFEDVSFAYPDSDRMVLEHVNLQISGRQKIALVGKNGCGKSTLIKLICRLYDPSEGRILLDGVDIRKLPREEYMSFLAVVFQDFQIFAATLGENIALGRKAEENRIRTVIEKVGLGITDSDTPLRRDLEENGVEVSGGEGQKIAIARALYKDAPMVILDEPTASLDPISESEIYAKFNSLVEGKLALFISHRLSSCRFCDRILVLQGGNIVQDGSHEVLAAQDGGLYREMWEAQSRYYV